MDMALSTTVQRSSNENNTSEATLATEPQSTLIATTIASTTDTTNTSSSTTSSTSLELTGLAEDELIYLSKKKGTSTIKKESFRGTGHRIGISSGGQAPMINSLRLGGGGGSGGGGGGGNSINNSSITGNSSSSSSGGGINNLDATAGGNINSGCDIQQHLQSMFYLLRKEETLKMAVKLETARPGRTRYLVVVSRPASSALPSPALSPTQLLLRPQNSNNLTTTTALSTNTNCDSETMTRMSALPPNNNSTSSSSSSSSLFPSTANINTTATTTVTTTSTSSSTTGTVVTNNNNNNNSDSNSTTQQSPSSPSIIGLEKLKNKSNLTKYLSNSFSSSNCSSSYSSNSASNRIQKYHDINNKSLSSDSSSPGMLSVEFTKQNCDTNSSRVNCSSGGGGGIVGSNVVDDDDDDDDDDDNDGCLSESLTNMMMMNSSCNEIEESCLLGIDCNEKTTVGLVLRILADTTIRLDGDGGFSICVFGRTHIFKPVSVQAMWSALQTLHKVSAKARTNNYYPGGPSHEWVSYYEKRIESERSCLNEWNAMDSLESRRPPSPDAVRNKPTQREEAEQVIKAALKEIMMSVDLDEVTSKYIRSRLEDYLDMDLDEFKSFIDQEMLIILGQMDAPTEIFDHVYLGSEWNASNLEELRKNGVGHILNVTREIDNFFPGMFDYCNIRVYDDEKTNLLKHWDNTFKYITRARKEGSKVLVHCKMGVSRSASVVIAYAMKAYNLNFSHALKLVKKKRNCIKPNKSFLSQLETYQGMLDAMKNKEKLQRSKSETNLRSSVKDARLLPGSEPTPLIQALNAAEKRHQHHHHHHHHHHGTMRTMLTRNVVARICVEDGDSVSNCIGGGGGGGGGSLMRNINNRKLKRRPQSWSPNHVEATILLPKQQSQSLENLAPDRKEERNKNFLFPCSNGQNYSVSQNQVVHLQENFVPSVKLIVSELESSTNRIGTSGGGIYRTGSEATPRKETWDPGELSGSGGSTGGGGEGGIVVGGGGCIKISQNVFFKNVVSNNVCDSPVPASPSQLQPPPPPQHWTSSAQIIHKSNSPINLSETTILSNNSNTQIAQNRTKDLQLDGAGSGSNNNNNNDIDNSIIPISSLLLQQQQQQQQQQQYSTGSNNSNHRELPSRHSSWGSGDNQRLLPSRNSSWGAYDIRTSNSVGSTRMANHEQEQSQNSIVLVGGQNVQLPYEREEIPWHPGTVKRTKLKIENNNAGVKRVCPASSIAQQPVSPPLNPTNKIVSAIDMFLITDPTVIVPNSSDTPPPTSLTTIKSKSSPPPLPQNRCNSEEILSVGNLSLQQSVLNNRLSASAPETSAMGFIKKTRLHTRTLPPPSPSMLMLMMNRSLDDDTSLMEQQTQHQQRQRQQQQQQQQQQNIYGIVQNLKMNFESKDGHNYNYKKVKSLPSSPVASHGSSSGNTTISGVGADKDSKFYDSATVDILEEINVKDLVGRYEISKTKFPTTVVTLDNSILTGTIITTTANNPVSQIITTSTSSTSSSPLLSSPSLSKPRPRSVFEIRQPQLINVTTKPLMITHSTIPKMDDLRRPPVPPAPTVKNALGAVTTVNIINNNNNNNTTIATAGGGNLSAAATTTTLQLSSSSATLPSSKNVVAAVACKRMQQHGKTHPLSRLGLPKQRLNTATYNTM